MPAVSLPVALAAIPLRPFRSDAATVTTPRSAIGPITIRLRPSGALPSVVYRSVMPGSAWLTSTRSPSTSKTGGAMR